ncbi:hypothetical protein [Streptomyces sp. NPDC019507]|uniref:hypothetical protein n=1 Tax=Streptomyces sp. NPDC019507 TaxID=3154689 RepID=UPI00340CED7C
MGSARSKRKQIRDAHVPLLALDHAAPWLGPDSGPRMVTYVPVDEVSRARLTQLQEPAPLTG